MKTRKILCSLESRATYGYSRNVMRTMQKFPQLEILTLVTGMHLMPEMGNSVDLIRKDGFPISAEVDLSPNGNYSPGAWSRAMAKGMEGFADTLEKLMPDVVLLFGDRAETMTLCLTAAYMGIPIAHVQAGDKSGHIDDSSRYAIAKLGHIHFASCQDSAERLRKLGEQEFRIFNTGAPQLDDIDRNFQDSNLIIEGSLFDLSKPYLLLLMHPVMVEREETSNQIEAAVESCLETKLNVIWIAPNSDLGHKDILKLISKYENYPNIKTVKNLERDIFLKLLYNCKALVGNSSSGILEAPSFKVPVINIGSRQRGRPQADNIVNCDNKKGSIKNALKKVLSDYEFLDLCKKAINPYGDGKSSERICKILSEINLDKKLLDKQIMY